MAEKRKAYTVVGEIFDNCGVKTEQVVGQKPGSEKASHMATPGRINQEEREGGKIAISLSRLV